MIIDQDLLDSNRRLILTLALCELCVLVQVDEHGLCDVIYLHLDVFTCVFHVQTNVLDLKIPAPVGEPVSPATEGATELGSGAHVVERFFPNTARMKIS